MPISPECDVGGMGTLGYDCDEGTNVACVHLEIQNPAWVHLANEGAGSKNDDDITDKLD